MHILHAIFFNNFTNYLYFYSKNCLILNEYMRLHELHANLNKDKNKQNSKTK